MPLRGLGFRVPSGLDLERLLDGAGAIFSEEIMDFTLGKPPFVSVSVSCGASGMSFFFLVFKPPPPNIVAMQTMNLTVVRGGSFKKQVVVII